MSSGKSNEPAPPPSGSEPREELSPRDAERRMQEAEERYRSLVEVTEQIVWTTTPAGEMSGEQPGWARLTGQSREAYEGRGWMAAVHPEDRARTLALWSEAIAGCRVFLHEHRVRTHAGGYHHYAVRAVPVLKASGEVREWVGAHTDITDRRRAEAERERLIGALERTNRELDQFAYVTSHDLKAPLRGIGNLSEWLEEELGEGITADARKYLGLLRGRVQRLEALIDGILRYARAGRAGERPEPIDSGKLVTETIELLSPPASVKFMVDGDMPAIVAERVPLQQVFLNLIGNAVKHARRDDACVEIHGKDAGLFWHFSVADNGHGIAPEHHERIWGMFQTLGAPGQGEGSGIGLSVVKKIVSTRSGQAWVESSLGRGAVFHVFWPKEEITI